ncbi:MAG TPA: hypothetical protein VLX92_25195 [Kofleriaceae bacterium]|nr:hypothetical protein [Kofleriaceae bacterium]
MKQVIHFPPVVDAKIVPFTVNSCCRPKHGFMIEVANPKVAVYQPPPETEPSIKYIGMIFDGDAADENVVLQQPLKSDEELHTFLTWLGAGAQYAHRHDFGPIPFDSTPCPPPKTKGGGPGA